MFQSSFYPWPPSFCSSSLLLTDYAPVVDVHRHRLPLSRFASSHLSPFSVSFPFLQQSGSKYILSLLQQSSISVSRLPQKSVWFSNLPSFSSDSRSLFFSHLCSLSFPFPRRNRSPSSSILLECFFFPSTRWPKTSVLIAHSWVNF